MTDVLAVIGFLLLQFIVLVLIGVRQEYRRRKDHMQRAVGAPYNAVETETPPRD